MKRLILSLLLALGLAGAGVIAPRTACAMPHAKAHAIVTACCCAMPTTGSCERLCATHAAQAEKTAAVLSAPSGSKAPMVVAALPSANPLAVVSGAANDSAPSSRPPTERSPQALVLRL